MVHEGLTNMNFDNVSESSENVATSYIVFELSYAQSISIDFTFFQRVFDYVQWKSNIEIITKQTSKLIVCYRKVQLSNLILLL